MNKKSTWLLAMSLAAVVTSSGIVSAAAQTEQGAIPQKAGIEQKHSFKGYDKFPGDQMERTALLDLLKMDEGTLKANIKEGKSLLVIANEHNVSEQALTDFFVSHMSARIQQGVQAGRFSADQAEKMKSKLQQRVVNMMRNTGHEKRRFLDMNELLQLLKIDAKTLHSEFKQGKSLLNIAEEHGVSEQQLKDFLINMVTKHIEEGVKEGRIAADKADNLKAKAMERVQKMMTSNHTDKPSWNQTK